MAIKVNTDLLESKAAYASSLALQLKEKASEINYIYFGLDSKIKNREGIGSSLLNMKIRIDKLQQKMYNISNFLNSAASGYRSAESRVQANLANIKFSNSVSEKTSKAAKGKNKEKEKKWYQSNWFKLTVGAVVVGAAVAAAVFVGGPILVGMAVGAVIGAGVGGIIGGVSSKASGGKFIDGFSDGSMWGSISGAVTGAAGAAGLGIKGIAAVDGAVDSLVYAGQTMQNGGDVTATGVATSFVAGAGFSALGAVASNKISGLMSKRVNAVTVKPEIKVLDNAKPSRIDYLREKYGKLSPEKLNEKINIRGENEEIVKGITKNKHGVDYGKYSTKLDSRVTEIEKMDLGKDLGSTFTDGRYRTVVTDDPVVTYRTFGGNSDASGGFATTNIAKNRIDAKIDTALLPEWGGSRMYEAKIEVPKGEILNIGKVAPQTIKATGTILKGGADQILLPRDWPLDWITNIRVVPSK